MNRALVILFSLMLVGSNAAFGMIFGMIVPTADGPAACGRCRCGRPSCCVTPSTPQSRPAPVSPQAGHSQQDARTVPAAALQLLYTQLDPDCRCSFGFSSRSQVIAVSLYQRTCSYLI